MRRLRYSRTSNWFHAIKIESVFRFFWREGEGDKNAQLRSGKRAGWRASAGDLSTNSKVPRGGLQKEHEERQIVSCWGGQGQLRPRFANFCVPVEGVDEDGHDDLPGSGDHVLVGAPYGLRRPFCPGHQLHHHGVKSTSRSRGRQRVVPARRRGRKVCLWLLPLSVPRKFTEKSHEGRGTEQDARKRSVGRGGERAREGCVVKAARGGA